MLVDVVCLCLLESLEEVVDGSVVTAAAENTISAVVIGKVLELLGALDEVFDLDLLLELLGADQGLPGVGEARDGQGREGDGGDLHVFKEDGTNSGG